MLAGIVKPLLRMEIRAEGAIRQGDDVLVVDLGGDGAGLLVALDRGPDAQLEIGAAEVVQEYRLDGPVAQLPGDLHALQGQLADAVEVVAQEGDDAVLL